MKIRKIKKSDTSEIIEFLKSIKKFNRLGLSESEAQNNIEKMIFMNIENSNNSIYVAEEEDKIIGFIGFHIIPYLILSGKTEGYISELFIREESRGKNIGGKLLDIVLKEAKEKDCTRLHLINFKDMESYKRGFYKKHGWEEREEGADFIYSLIGK